MVLHHLASVAQRGSVNEAVKDIEEYLDEVQDEELPDLLRVFTEYSTDEDHEAVRNYYATR